MNIITNHRLPDGPIIFTARGLTIAAMADVIIKARCWSDADDAILVLTATRRWKLPEVMYHLEDAMAVAVQYAVAMEMSA